MPRLSLGDLRADERRARVLGRLSDQRVDAAVRALAELRGAHPRALAARAADACVAAPAVDSLRAAAASGARCRKLSGLVRRATPQRRLPAASGVPAPFVRRSGPGLRFRSVVLPAAGDAAPTGPVRIRRSARGAAPDALVARLSAA